MTAGTQFVARSSLFSSPLFRVLRYCNNTRHKDDRNEKSDNRVTNWASVAPRRITRRFQHTQVLRSDDCWRGSISCPCSHNVKTTDKRRSAPLAAAYVYVRIEASLICSVETHHCRRVGVSGAVLILLLPPSCFFLKPVVDVGVSAVTKNPSWNFRWTGSQEKYKPWFGILAESWPRRRGQIPVSFLGARDGHP